MDKRRLRNFLEIVTATEIGSWKIEDKFVFTFFSQEIFMVNSVYLRREESLLSRCRLLRIEERHRPVPKNSGLWTTQNYSDLKWDLVSSTFAVGRLTQLFRAVLLMVIMKIPSSSLVFTEWLATYRSETGTNCTNCTKLTWRHCTRSPLLIGSEQLIVNDTEQWSLFPLQV